MKDVVEILRAKEQELLRVKRQVEALRIALPLLSEAEDTVIPSAPAPIKSNGHQN